jgi:decaprenylphospho-beta-D-ribofuranose 2-oxidase
MGSPAAVSPLPHTSLRELSGWGMCTRSLSMFAEPETPDELRARLRPHARVGLGREGITMRGLGRSYGDPAINAGGLVLGTRRMDRYLGFDAASGVLTVEAGASLAGIIDDFAPRGFFPMITPGTKYVTVGGAIANDVHGKAHHVQGCFSACVQSMRMLLASGEVVQTSRSERPALFWATFGGMGLTGVVLDATITLRPIETTYFRQKAISVGSLEEMLAALEEQDSVFPYSVAWVDPRASGASLGRGVLTVGDHARRDELPPELAREPLLVSGPPKVTVPFELPELTLNPLTTRALNLAMRQVLVRGKPFAHYEKFFYPLDFVAEWNRGYGHRGFTQYQFVIPFEDGLRRMRAILDAIMSSGELPLLNVLKRFGKESGGLLSFPREGYTFAIDFPIRSGTVALVRRLDAMVLEAGGRIYLGKDAYVEPQTFRAMYPAVDAFLAVKREVDPEGLFSSDQARRVGLVP